MIERVSVMPSNRLLCLELLLTWLQSFTLAALRGFISLLLHLLSLFNVMTLQEQNQFSRKTSCMMSLNCCIEYSIHVFQEVNNVSLVYQVLCSPICEYYSTHNTHSTHAPQILCDRTCLEDELHVTNKEIHFFLCSHKPVLNANINSFPPISKWHVAHGAMI